MLLSNYSAYKLPAVEIVKGATLSIGIYPFVVKAYEWASQANIQKLNL